MDPHTAPPVFDPVLTTLDPGERTTQISGEELHGLQNVGNDYININGHTRVAMLLDRDPANNEVRNIMSGQGGDGCLGSLHHAGSSGILSQQISSLVRHT